MLCMQLCSNAFVSIVDIACSPNTLLGVVVFQMVALRADCTLVPSLC